MTRRERLLRTLRGETVDRPPVNFYEVNGLVQGGVDFYGGATASGGEIDPFHIYSDPSWRPLLELAREKTDLILLHSVGFKHCPPDPLAERRTVETWEDANGSRLTRTTLRADDRELVSLARRDRDIDTTWCLEHFLKDEDDLRAWLALPDAPAGGEPDIAPVLELEARVGEAGLVMLDTPDALCGVAPLFEMGDYTVIALTERELFLQALEKVQRTLLPRIEAVAAALPGRLWRIYGPEYAAPPYLPPTLFDDYVVRYVTPLVEAIHRHGGYARIHSHGRLREILDRLAATGCCGLDPIEPPPQGDVELAYVRERVGGQMVLFGNLEISDIETLPPERMAEKVRTALREGTAGAGRGFVLMPSAAPYGRHLPARTLRNYETIVETVEREYGG